jgi:hypothetical protein
MITAKFIIETERSRYHYRPSEYQPYKKKPVICLTVGKPYVVDRQKMQKEGNETDILQIFNESLRPIMIAGVFTISRLKTEYRILEFLKPQGL